MKKKQKTEKEKKEKKQEHTVIDLARLEKDYGRERYNKPDGSGRKHTREVFKLWLTLPDTFKGVPDRITELLGITDPITLEILKYKTMQAFADEFGVQPASLSRWRKEIESDSDFIKDVKKQLQAVTRNVLGAFYRKALEEGDAQRVKLWLQYVEDWREQLGVEHSGHVSNLSDEERKKLDEVIKKNTIK